MKFSIGRRMKTEVMDLQEAVDIYCHQRDNSGEGASTFPDGKIEGGYKISYNGRVWLNGEAVSI
jgi:hypothetical protein